MLLIIMGESMLYFASKPDRMFNDIIRKSLELSIDELKDPDMEDWDVLSCYLDQTVNIFERKELLEVYEKLLDAHLSLALYKVTDYHFLLLFDSILQAVEYHNDMWRNERKCLFTGTAVHEIDMDSISDIFFWDTDFLIDSGDFDSMAPDVKQKLCVNKELFGVVHGMKPHAEEISISVMDIPEDWGAENNLYKENHDYPFFDKDSMD